jgi:hypothetical protein
MMALVPFYVNERRFVQDAVAAAPRAGGVRVWEVTMGTT